MAIKKHQRGFSLVYTVKDIPYDAGGVLQSISGHTCKFFWREQFKPDSEESATVDLAGYDDDQEVRVELRTPAQTKAMNRAVFLISLRLKNDTSNQVIELLAPDDRKIAIVEEATKSDMS